MYFFEGIFQIIFFSVNTSSIGQIYTHTTAIRRANLSKKEWVSMLLLNLSIIYSTNKKTLSAGFRAKLSHLAKFPRDIGTAEEKTNGNPNILSQPEFLPVKKLNYDEIFGTPSPKKSAKGKVTSSASKSKWHLIDIK